MDAHILLNTIHVSVVALYHHHCANIILLICMTKRMCFPFNLCFMFLCNIFFNYETEMFFFGQNGQKALVDGLVKNKTILPAY